MPKRKDLEPGLHNKTRPTLFLVPILLTAWLGAGPSADITLVQAVKAGNVQTVRAMVKAKADANSAEPDGTTALHWAVQNGNVEMVDLLIRSGAKVAATNRYGVTPLTVACTAGNAAIVERLLAAGADPNGSLSDGETPLMTAARTGSAETIKALIARSADVNARERRKGQTALMWAAAENNVAAIRALIEAGADVNERSTGGSFTPYLFAIRAGHIDAAHALIDAGVNVNQSLADGTSALVLAVMNAHYELAAALLDKGANPNADNQGWTALHQIAWSRRHNAGFNLPGPVATGGLDSLDLVRKLVQKGANVNARMTREPRDGNRNQLNRIGSTPFLMAAKSDDVPLMRVLLETGADPSLTTNHGTTALMAAAGVGIWAPGENPGTHEEALAAVKLALDVGGGKVNDVDQDGETALHGAVYRGGAIPVIQFLIDKGATLDVKNKKGWTPVVVADGVEYTPAVLKRYPEAAALLRKTMRERGLAVPPPNHSAEKAADQDAVAGGKTIWDGVFTDEQAGRGSKIYAVSCAPCHKTDLLGDSGTPALAGADFFSRFSGSSVDDLVKTIRASMPQDAPDSLGTPAYVDLVGYLLKANGGSAGTTELSQDSAALKQIRITNPK
jgi:ankyrin repeat protein/mono/diheme cytochrome c family protein